MVTLYKKKIILVALLLEGSEIISHCAKNVLLLFTYYWNYSKSKLFLNWRSLLQKQCLHILFWLHHFQLLVHVTLKICLQWMLPCCTYNTDVIHIYIFSFSHIPHRHIHDITPKCEALCVTCCAGSVALLGLRTGSSRVYRWRLGTGGASHPARCA